MTVDRDVSTDDDLLDGDPAPAPKPTDPAPAPAATPAAGATASRPAASAPTSRAGMSGLTQESAGATEVSTATVLAYAVAGAAVLGWFFFGWLVLEQGFVDSVGESAGAAFALLLIVSIVGTVRRSRRH